jgi:hypothetical protein
MSGNSPITTRRTMLELGAAGASLATLGAVSQPAHANTNEAIAQLKAMNARYIHECVTNDVPSHSAIIHERYVEILTRGQRLNRQQHLARWATGFDPEVFLYWDTRDELISIFGPVGLVRSTNKYVVRRDGKETTGMTAYTDTYFYEDGKWMCVQAQLTAVTPENYPSDDTIVSVYIKGKLQK